LYLKFALKTRGLSGGPRKKRGVMSEFGKKTALQGAIQSAPSPDRKHSLAEKLLTGVSFFAPILIYRA